METETQPTIQHIEVRQNRAGQPRAYIVGTRIRVQDIYVQTELRGCSPDEIVAAYPHLSLGQIHAALSYFYDHRQEILDEYDRDRTFAEDMEAQQQPSKFTRLRDGLLNERTDANDSVSS